MNKRKWSDSERVILIDLFPDNYTEYVCIKLNRSYASVSSQANLLGLKKSDSFRKMELEKQAERLRIVGVNSRYKKGRSPENKGKRQEEFMSKEAINKSAKTRFKKDCLESAYNTIKSRTGSMVDGCFVKDEGPKQSKEAHEKQLPVCVCGGSEFDKTFARKDKWLGSSTQFMKGFSKNDSRFIAREYSLSFEFFAKTDLIRCICKQCGNMDFITV